MNPSRRLLRLALCLLPGLAAAAWAGGPTVIAPPTINLLPHHPVLDQQCVDRLKGSGASTARAAHECRKAREPGTPAQPGPNTPAPPPVSSSSPKP